MTISYNPIFSSMSPSVGEARGDVMLTALSRDDGSPQETFVFQHFPEQVSDSKAVSWQTKEIPGGSLPIYQWTGSGERVLSFKATFASDIDFLAQGLSRAEEMQERIKAAGLERSNIDIRGALGLLRRYVLPTYGDDTGLGVPVSFAPSRLRLFIPGSGIGVTGGIPGGIDPVSPDSAVCVMTQCDIDILEFFPSGLPRIAEVQLSFAQVPQIGNGMIVFPQAPEITARNRLQYRGGTETFLPYTMTPRHRGGD